MKVHARENERQEREKEREREGKREGWRERERGDKKRSVWFEGLNGRTCSHIKSHQIRL